MRTFVLLFGLVYSLSTASLLRAGEWPQILGPNRNGVAEGESIAGSWPKSGPRTVWQREVGSGFSGIAVADGKAVLFHRVDDEELVEAMDAATGEVLWKAGRPTSFSTPYSPDDGPRSTPVIHKGTVYVFGAQGVLRCLQLESGKEVWSRETHREFKAPEGYFGAGSTPIVEGDKLVVNVGSRDGAGIVAFDRATGRTRWKATDEFASYSSPVAATIDGVRHLIFITRMKTVSLNPQDGRIRFEYPFGRRGPTVNGASPVVVDGHLFTTAHYGVGAVWAKLGKGSAETIWSSDEILSSHYATPIAHEGKLYGIHGQERLDEPILRCIDPATRTVHWSKPGIGYGSIIKADGKLLFVTTEGDLVLIEPNSERYKELARAKLLRTATRALPALANGLLYVRGAGTLKCVDLRRAR